MRKIILFFVLIFGFSSAHAAMSPLSIAVVPPIQFPADDFSITGLRASVLWGNHRDVYGIDLGLIGNVTQQDFVGLGLSGIFNATHGTTTVLGAQLAGGANLNYQKTKVIGVQAALGYNYQTATSSVVGLQLAAANIAKHTTVYGFQVGVYNHAKEVYGFQIGLVNRANNLHGLQIGLINFHEQGVFAISPILNFGF